MGLLGGSFNPPHKGHVHISLAAMNALKLDAVWWLVTPQNPLKKGKIKPLDIDQRLAMSKDLIEHPKILVSDIERDLGTTITYFSIKKLKQRYPNTDFVWISGMDNASNLHKWNHWRRLLDEICMVHLTRMPATSLIQKFPLRMQSNQRHSVINHAARYVLRPGISYWLMQKKMVNISSTEIRENNLESNG